MSQYSVLRTIIVGFVVLATAITEEVRADAFDEYTLTPTDSFELPYADCVFDVLSDGRVIVLYLANVYVEDAVGTGAFTLRGTLSDADMPSSEDGWGAAFIRVSPDGTKIAAGNNGGAYPWHNFEVGVFDFPALSGGWFGINHYDAEWYDDTHLALTAGAFGSPSIVTVLDTTSSYTAPENPTVIENIGGSSGGVTFDSVENLYTGNAYKVDGPSETGEIKVFDNGAWTPALSGEQALDFETAGALVIDILSAASLGFDAEGNLHVGGGDWYGGTGDINCAALVRASAVSDAVAGLGPADPDDSTEVRRFDPDESVDDSFYTVNYNPTTRQLYLTDSWTSNTVYVYTAPSEPIPTMSEWGVVVMALSLFTAGTLTIGRHRRFLDTRGARAVEDPTCPTPGCVRGETVK